MLSKWLLEPHTENEYKEMVYETLSVHKQQLDELWNWVCSTDYFKAPASTQYHGAEPFGLVKHSLAVWDALKEHTQHLLPPEVGRGTDAYDRDGLVAALFHDVVKCNLYREVQKWRKDKNGRWESYPGYEVDVTQIQIDHGAESLRRIEKYYEFEHEAWAMAVAYHMGPPDQYIAKKQYYQAIEAYPEVLCLYTADVYATFITGY